MTREEREKAIEIIRKYECNAEHYEACEAIIKALEQDAIIIPEGTTNGDVIKAMFPKNYTHIYDRSVSSWWNAPYKGLK